jgi:hypothetical protein
LQRYLARKPHFYPAEATPAPVIPRFLSFAGIIAAIACANIADFCLARACPA